jgi:hypothetical protein
MGKVPGTPRCDDERLPSVPDTKTVYDFESRTDKTDIVGKGGE